ADSPYVDIQLDTGKIKNARERLKAKYELEKTEADDPSKIEPLETRVLADTHQIVIEDRGHGMTRDDVNVKFLWAGRRRRRVEPETKGRSPKGRPIMGRKGLGKLAGFGVAKIVEVTTRAKGEKHATKITLDFDDIMTKQSVQEVEVKEERL